MVKRISESRELTQRQLSRYKSKFDDIADSILGGTNSDVPNNIKDMFAEYGGSCRVNVKPNLLHYDGYIIRDGKNHTIAGDIYLNDLYRNVRRLAQDFIYADYINDYGDDATLNIYEFNRLVYEV